MNTSGGYAGLVALLITCLLVAFLFWRMDLFSGTRGASPIERTGAIKAAEQAKQMIESRYNQPF